MREQPSNDAGITKRDFLKLGACALCAAGVAPLGPGAHAQTTPGAGPQMGAQPGLIRSRRSPWFESLEGGGIRCRLCPRRCEIAEGMRGPCRVRGNWGGEGYTLVYGNPALVQTDPVERKPFFHVLPGTRALSLSTAGCNLACMFCEVWDMALVAPDDVHAYDISPEEALRQAQQSGIRSLSYAFGEPIVFYEYVDATADLAKEAGLLNLVHTAAYIEPEPLRRWAGKIDAFNVDLKSFDAEFYRDVCDGELEPVLDALRLLKEEGVHIEITNIVIPSLNDDMEMIGEMCEWISEELGPGTPIHFARFYPLYRLANLPPTPVSTLEEARETAQAAGLDYVYLSRVTGHDAENTFCPGCGEKVIERRGFVVTGNHLNDGACSHCGASIPGKWA